MLFGELIIWYLFFASIGSGIYLMWFFVYVIAWKKGGVWYSLSKQTQRPLLIFSYVSLAIGSLCLLLDLSLSERAHLLVSRANFTALTVGTYTLLGFLLSLIYLIVASFSKRGGSKAEVVQFFIHILATILALVTIIYAGILVSTLSAVPFWNTPFMPILFILSSLSIGVAVLLSVGTICAASKQRNFQVHGIFTKIDIVLILFETLVIILIYYQFSDHAVGSLSIAKLMQGELFIQFWFGFIACAIILPLLMETFILITKMSNPAFFAVLACFILVGGFYLRYCIINAGVHLSFFLDSGLAAI